MITILLKIWFNLVKEFCKNAIIAVIGNKIDLFEEEIDQKEAKEFNAKFQLTSAINEETGIDEIIEDLVKDYIKSKGGNIEKGSFRNDCNNIKHNKNDINKFNSNIKT
jgi:GTPase SAR1 family protein